MEKIDPKGFLSSRRQKRAVQPVQPAGALPKAYPNTQTGPCPEEKQPWNQRKIVGGIISFTGKSQRGGKSVLIQKGGKIRLNRAKAQPPAGHPKTKEKKNNPGKGAGSRRNPVQQRLQEGEKKHTAPQQMQNAETDSLGGNQKSGDGGQPCRQQKAPNPAAKIAAGKPAGTAGNHYENAGKKISNHTEPSLKKKIQPASQKKSGVICPMVQHHQ